MNFDLKSYLNEQMDRVNRALATHLPPKTEFPPVLHDSMHYSLFAPGKRIRPILCLAGVQACGGNTDAAMPVACALEMIHAFSLIHDDLPAMDDDDLRRGVPTNHKVYGEAVAILSGDALIAQAFLVLGRLKDSSFPANRVLEVIADIAWATGSAGMVGGQVVDMESEGKSLDVLKLKRLHQLKTGRLIAVSVLSGAKLATAESERLEAIKTYGEAIGLAFQIADDILDITGGPEIGKDVGSDMANHKSTYPSVMGIDAARVEARSLVDKALHALDGFGEEAEALRAIASYIIERKK